MKLKSIVAAIAMVAALLLTVTTFALPGSYKQTCRRCHMDRGMLRCLCLNRNQRLRRTALPQARRCNHIKNVNGNLVCRGRRVPPRPRVRKKVFGAGPIWNTSMAQRVCPTICGRRPNFPRWTGQWWSKNGTSFCECRR